MLELFSDSEAVENLDGLK